MSTEDNHTDNLDNRIVIDMGAHLDDDDVTLPSLPAVDVDIVETPRIIDTQLPADIPAVAPSQTSSDRNKPSSIVSTPTSLATATTAAIEPESNSSKIEPDRVPQSDGQQTDKPAVLQSSAEGLSEPATSQQTNTQSGGWLSRMKTGLTKSRKHLAEGMVNILVGGKEIDDELLEEVEDQLLVADIGVEATNRIITNLTAQADRGDLIYSNALYKALQKELLNILTPRVAPLQVDTSKTPYVLLMVGVNGVGKTTTIGKIAKKLQQEGKSVMLAAGDTFRAAASEQLQVWGERNNIPVVAQGEGSDSASVIYDAMQSAKARSIDVLIADTAGRLHNKSNLMEELKKVVRIMQKHDETAPHETMLVIDAGTGQNAINQVNIFNEAVPVTGLTITKLDGTAKGGVIFNIANSTDIPIRFIGVGESIDDLQPFKPKQFVAALFETD